MKRKIILMIVLLLLMILALILNWQKASLTEQELLSSEYLEFRGYGSEKSASNNSSNQATNNSITYAKTFLSEKGKKVYDLIIKNAVDHNTKQFSIPAITMDSFTRVYMSFLNDNPHIFYVSSVKYYVDQDDIVKDIRLIFNASYNDRIKKQALIDENENAILEKVDANWSDYEKVKYLYDYIIKNTAYDIKASDNQNIYSVLVNKKSVCAGYARTLQYLMTKLDMFCLYVTGKAKDTLEGSIDHAWNLVKMGNEYYYIDVTWGDPVVRLKQVNNDYIGYSYFGITTEDLELTHIIDKTYPLPIASGIENNYYIKEELYIDNVDIIRSKIINELIYGSPKNQKYYSFKFSNHEIYDYAKENILVGEYFKEIIAEVNKVVNYKYRNLYLAIYPYDEKLIVDIKVKYEINRDIIKSKIQGN